MSSRKRTSQRALCSPEVIRAARERIAKGESQRRVAKSLGMAESTLRKRLQRSTVATCLGRYDTTFTKEMEQELCQYIKTLDNMFYGLTSRALRCLAFEFAEQNKIKHRFNGTSKMAGKGWLRGFLKRHEDISLRQPTATSVARAIGFNQPQCKRFYDNLLVLLETYKFAPHAIYNLDESGFSTVPNKPPKILFTKGKRCVNKISSAERGTNVTAVCAMSAGGQFVPPAFIYPRKRMKAELLDGAPPSSIGMTSDSSFINCELFIEYMSHFKDHVKPSKETPILLIMDNHISHCSFAAVDFCRDNNIKALTLPPHSSHRMQPSDRCFFSPLKKFYASECEKWMTNHPGRVITIYQIASIFAPAYFKAATVANAVEGFKVTGICPFNNDIFTEADFMASNVTERGLPQSPTAESEVPTILASELPTAVLDNAIAMPENAPIVPENTAIVPKNPTAEPESLTSPVSATSIVASTSATSGGSSESTSFVSLTEIQPLPKSIATRSTNRKSKKSEILTSSSFRIQLIEELEKKKPKRKPELTLNQAAKKSKANLKKKVTPKMQNSTKNKRLWQCPGCEELYEEPITEDWIECISCTRWWHDKCTTYSGLGPFSCDTCT